jgi:mono/diheme cytochrome c family protein
MPPAATGAAIFDKDLDISVLPKSSNVALSNRIPGRLFPRDAGREQISRQAKQTHWPLTGTMLMLPCCLKGFEETRRIMRAPVLLAITVLAVTALGSAAWFATAPAKPFATNDARLAGTGNPARGRLVFAAADCASCHALPGQQDRLRLGGGLALASPYGIFRVPNISPDPIDGIGAWSAADLANALVAGVSPHGQHYYPSFPYTSYTGMQLGDIKDLFAYLRTLPPVKGRPPPHDLALIFKIRRVLGAWKLLFFRQGQPAAQTVQGAPDRGRYLVEAVAHCAECHSSRNSFGAIRKATLFAGGVDPEGTGFIPNITPARIGQWSEKDIAEMLKTGNTPDHGRVGSSMADVVTNTAMLPQADRDAIARYIKALPYRTTPQP